MDQINQSQTHHFNLHLSNPSNLNEINVELKTEPKENFKKSTEAMTNFNLNSSSVSTLPPPQVSVSMDKRKSAEFKNCSTEFFHFVRLMQLFPNVHPATLHTVMTLCKSDFFVAVDRLLYAKRCKEMCDNRKKMHAYNLKGNRCVPYSCTTSCNSCKLDGCCHGTSSSNKSNVMKIEASNSNSRKQPRRSRGEKFLNSNQLQEQQEIPKSPITFQCNVPLRPLSPIINNNIQNVEEVEVVVTQM